jgi:hypothetical protein
MKSVCKILFEILAPLCGVQLFSDFVPVVFASLQPPATICQPSGLMPALANIGLLHY